MEGVFGYLLVALPINDHARRIKNVTLMLPVASRRARPGSMNVGTNGNGVRPPVIDLLTSSPMHHL